MVFAVGILAAIDWQTGGALVVIAAAVAGVFTTQAARSWKSERDAQIAKADRLTQELAEEKVRCAKETAEILEEQREIRHELKAELAAAEMEASVLRKMRDTTEVLQGVETILAQLARSKDVTTEIVAELLEKADERAALRDTTMISTQREIVVQLEHQNAVLERLADRIVGEVGDVVQAKVDELNTDLPSPDRQE